MLFQHLTKLLKKERNPMLLMFYAPCKYNSMSTL